MTQITSIHVENFVNIAKEVVFQQFDQRNILAGLFGSVKKSFARAILFGIGASMKQLSVTQYSELNASPDAATSVQLTLLCNNQNHIIKRSLLVDATQSFTIDNADNSEEAYLAWLKSHNFDLNVQMLFCDSANVKDICNMLVTAPLQLFGTITDLSKSTAALIQKMRLIDEKSKILKTSSDIVGELTHHKDELKAVLPEQASFAVRFQAYTISKLKREEVERLAMKARLETVQNQLDTFNTNMADLTAAIATETELFNQKQRVNQTLLGELERMENLPGGEYCELVYGIQKFMFGQLMEKGHMCINDAEVLIKDLERLKNEAETNMAFMNGANGTKRKSRMIPRDAMLKLYPVYHRNDELEMDKLEYEILKAKAILARRQNEQKMFDFFEQVLPQRKLKEMAGQKTLPEIVVECNSKLKAIFHPNAYIQSDEELKLHLLRSLIPSEQGFLLNGTFRANDERNQFLIDNILADYSYTIALFEDNDDQQFQQSIFESLTEENAEWYKNVKFLVLSELPKPKGREGYVAPPDHWLTYCTFTHTGIDGKCREKLMNYMGTQLDIICVNSGAEVKEAYRNGEKKYVASIDGQYIYTRHSMGFDVIKLIRPGKKVNDMQFPAACQRLEEAIQNLTEFLSNVMEMEKVPRRRPTSNIAATQAQVDQLEQQMAPLQQQKNAQMEALYIRMNTPYEASEVQNYADALVAEQHRLDAINGRITAAQNDIVRLRTEDASLVAKIDAMTKCIELNGRIDVNKRDIVEHKKTIKEYEKRIAKLTKTVAELQLKIDDLRQKIQFLKYKTIRTVLRANQENVNWTNVNCDTVPGTLWQDIRNGTYIDPMAISITFTDMRDTFDPDVFYANQGWYDIINACHDKENSLISDINDGKTEVDNIKRHINRIRVVVTDKFSAFLLQFNTILSDIGREIHPGIVYELKFDIDEHINDEKPAQLTMKTGDTVVGFKSLSESERIRTSWLLFAALHEYTRPPFAFIDLEYVNEETATIIYPIVRRMSLKTQLFVDSCSTMYSYFAKVFYGIYSNEGISDVRGEVKVIRVDPAMCQNEDDGDVDQGGDGDVDQ